MRYLSENLLNDEQRAEARETNAVKFGGEEFVYWRTTRAGERWYQLAALADDGEDGTEPEIDDATTATAAALSAPDTVYRFRLSAVAERPTMQDLADNGEVYATERRERVLADERRQTSRAAIRRGIAARSMLEARIVELREVADGIEARKEEAAASHVAKCQPIQAQLAAIEEKQITKIRDRNPVDEKLEAKRRDLLAQLEDHNAELELTIAGLNRLLARNVDDQRAVGREMGDCPQENELIDTAPAELRMKLRVKQSHQEHASNRVRAIEERLSLHRGDEYLTALLADCLEQAAAASAAVQEAYRQCIEA